MVFANNTVPKKAGTVTMATYHAKQRLESGRTRKIHSHKELHEQTQEVVQAESAMLARKMNQMEAHINEKEKDMQQKQEQTQNILEGGEQPRKELQSDKACIKQLRMQKRLIDNEIGDLKERESKRLHADKTAQHETIQQAAETAKSSVDIVAERIEGETTADKKATLAAQRKAALQALKAKDAKEKRMQRAVLAKA